MDKITTYKRFENESDEELILRICQDKEQIGSWNDVAIILNELTGNDYGESTYRKKFQAFQKMLNANRSKFVDSSAQLEEINEKLTELRKERIKLQTVNVERNRIDRSESRQEMYYEYIASVMECLPLPDFKPLFDNSENNLIREYVVGLADVHYGATFVSENNEYSPTIAKERLEYLTGRLATFVEEKRASKLHIVSLGDLLQGCLRLTDLRINDSTVVKSCVEISRLIAMFLNELSVCTNIEYYHVPSANHTQTRYLGSKANEIMDEDLEYLIGNYIKDLCANNKRINVHLAKEGKQYVEIPVEGYNIVAMHGHQIKNIESSIKDLSMMRRDFVEYLLLGHYHAGKTITSSEGCCNDAEILIAPSFVGSDPYSDSLMKGCKAAVNIYGFNELYGHDETYKIILN